MAIPLSASSAIFSASIREGRVALSVGHPRGTHSRYVIGCCLIPLGICGLENNSRRITYVILLHEKFLQFDWFRAVVFQLNLKYLHVKITDLLRVVV